MIVTTTVDTEEAKVDIEETTPNSAKVASPLSMKHFTLKNIPAPKKNMLNMMLIPTTLIAIKLLLMPSTTIFLVTPILNQTTATTATSPASTKVFWLTTSRIILN